MCSDQQSGRSRAAWLAALGLIVLVGFGLRVHQLGTDGLWVDEIGHVRVASSPIRDLLAGVRRHGGAAPLDYMLLHVWAMPGRQDFWVRVPAALWGTLCLPVVYRLGRKLAGSTVGLIAAGLLACSVFHVRYSQEARFYALAALLTASLCDAFGAAAADGARRWRWVLYTALVVLGLYSYYFILCVVGLQWLALLYRLLRARRDGAKDAQRNLLWPVIGTVLAVALWLPWLAYDLSWPSAHALGPTELSYPLLRDAVLQVTGLGAWPWAVPVFLAVSGYGAVRMLLSRPRGLQAVVLVLVCLVSPVVIFWLDRMASYFFAARQMLFVLPLFAVLAANGIEGIGRQVAAALTRAWDRRSPRGRLAMWVPVTLLAAVFCAANLDGVRAYYHWPRDDWRSPAEFLATNIQPDDQLAAPLSYYVEYYHPELGEHVVTMQPPFTAEVVSQAVDPQRALWFVTSPNYPHVGIGDDVEAWLVDAYGGFWEFGLPRFRIVYASPTACEHDEPEGLGITLTPGVVGFDRRCPGG